MTARYSPWTRRAATVTPLLGFVATLVLSAAAAVVIVLMPEAEPALPLSAAFVPRSEPGRPVGQHPGVGDAGYTDVSMDANGTPIAPWFYWEGRDQRLGYAGD